MASPLRKQAAAAYQDQEDLFHSWPHNLNKRNSVNPETERILRQIIKPEKSSEHLHRLIQILEKLKTKLPPDKLQNLIDQLKTLYPN